MSALNLRPELVVDLDAYGVTTEEYIFASGDTRVCIYRNDHDQHTWALVISTGDGPPTAAGEEVEKAKVIKAACDMLLRLHRPVKSTAADMALSAEVQVGIEEREWSHARAAAEFDMTASRLSALLNGQAHWSATDLVRLADAFGGDREDNLDRLAQMAGNAHRSATTRVLKRHPDVDRRLAAVEN